MKLFHSLPLVVGLFTFGALFAPASSFAKYEWGFADVSINHLDWASDTEGKSTKVDFNYLELEGGVQYSWGETYGFFDIENIGKKGEDVRTAAKGTIRYYLGKTGFNLYGHVYNFTSLGFSEQNRVFGLGYNFIGEGWWFKPFIGKHDVSQTYFSGGNGFMAGWIVGYNFAVAGQKFLLSDWHEYEFDRKPEYALGNGNATSSQNGAAAIWWDALPEVSLGLQWRYAIDKLGTKGPLNAGIGSLVYKF